MARIKNADRAEPMRFRLSVPHDDEAVLSWIGRQHNLSMSVRFLIKQAIQTSGYKDVFSSNCDDLTQLPKRGRPKTQVEETEEPVQEEPSASDDLLKDLMG